MSVRGKKMTDARGALRERMSYVRRYSIRIALAEATLWCAVVVCASALAMLCAEKWFYLPAAIRICVLILFGSCLLTVAFWRFTHAITRFGALAGNARELEKTHPKLKTRLSSALEFCALSGAKYGQSTALMDAAVEQACALIEDRAEVRKLCAGVLSDVRKRSGRALRIAVLLAGAFMLTGAQDPLALYRALESYSHPLKLLEREKSYQILVRPGDRTILRGDSLRVTAVGTIGKPGGMSLQLSQAGQPSQCLEMAYNPGQFEHTLTIASVQNDFRYHVTNDGVSSDTFSVTVTNNPFVTQLSLTYEYPSYTSLESYTTTREKAIQGLRGSRVIISGRSSNPLDSAWIRLEPDSIRSAAITDQRGFSDTLTLAGDGNYSILLLDHWGLASSDTLTYPITVIADERPAVALRHPRGQSDLNEEMVQPLVYELADDFGLSRLRLNYRRIRPSGDEGEPRSLTVASWPGPHRPAHVLEQYNWNLNSLGLLPEDEVAYSLTVFDNDRVSGPKSASTAEYRIRFPSLEEIFEREQDRQQQIVTELSELEEQGEQLQEQVKKLNETIERGEQLQWEDNQQLSQALQQQRKMLEEVKQLSEDLQQSLDQLQRGDMMSSELIEKMRKVQQLMAEVSTEELTGLMSQIQQSIDRMDPRALEEEMAKLQVSQEGILQKLDKTLALLERLKLEQKLDDLVRQTEEIARAAAALADSTGSLLDSSALAAADSAAARFDPPSAAAGDTPGAPGSAQAEKSPEPDSTTSAGARREEGAASETSASVPESRGANPDTAVVNDGSTDPELMSRMVQNTSAVGERTAGLFEQIEQAVQPFGEAGELETAAALLGERVNQQGPAERNIEQALAGYRQGQPEQSYLAQRSLKHTMQQMSGRMRKYREELRSKWQGEVAEAFKRAFDQLSYLSENQEAVLIEARAEPDFSHPDILSYAAREQEIVQGLDAVRREMVEAAKNNFFVSNQLLSILYMATSQGEHSMRQLGSETRLKAPALSSLERSLTVINAGMLTLLQDSDNMQQSSSATGMDQMLKKMKEMAQRQQQLNQAGKDALGQQQQGQGGAPGLGQGQGQQSGELMEMLRQMAAEQEAIRRQLEQMASRAGGRSEKMGNVLEGAAREAAEVVKELRERGLSREVLERQNRIFNRLLDAQRAIQERESGRRRKSERPEDFTISRPEGLPQGLLESEDGQELLRQQMKRWKGGYPDSYRNLIRRYYELLKIKGLEQ